MDSSLIAAFLSERDSETLTKRQLRKLRRILAKLATGADHDEQLVNEALSGPHIDGISLSSSTMDRSNETSSALSDATSPLASPRSTSSAVSFSSLGFLHAAFPGVSPIRLERVITEASCDGQFADGVDVERAIHLLLDEEFLPDLVEDDALDLPPTPREEWPTVEIKGKKKRTKSKTVIVNDIRQQRHVYKSASGSCHGPRFIIPPRSPDVDIWSSISSISAQLAALLPPHSESFFKSFFHSPDSKTPATAVRRALTAIIRDSDVPPLDMIVLLNLQDILRSTPEYDEISTEGQKRLFSDAHLCLHAVGSQADNAFDIVRLLRRLDKDDEAGWKVAPYHQGPLLHQDNSFLEASEDTPFPTSEAHLELRLGRPPGRPPSQLQNEWNVVPGRKRPTAVDHHQGSIPASNDSHETSTHQNGIAGDNDLARLNERVDDLKTRMEESYMSAARAWKGGNSKNRGRQVSMYYVEEVRTFFCTVLSKHRFHSR